MSETVSAAIGAAISAATGAAISAAVSAEVSAAVSVAVSVVSANEYLVGFRVHDDGRSAQLQCLENCRRIEIEPSPLARVRLMYLLIACFYALHA